MNDHHNLLNDLVNEYAGSVGMDSLSLDESGRCSLLFDDRFTVTLESHPDTGALILHSEIGPLPAGQEHALSAKILEANYFWQHTGGIGTLALAPAIPNVPQTIVLMSQTPLQSLDFAAFQSHFSDFIDTTEAWIDYLTTFGEDDSDDHPLPDTGFDSSMIRI